METEHIVETDASGSATRTTIVREAGSSKSGSSIVLLLAILVLAAVAFFAFSQMSDAEVAKDNALAQAAGSVGEAADDVGAAATNAGNAVEQGVSSLTE